MSSQVISIQSSLFSVALPPWSQYLVVPSAQSPPLDSAISRKARSADGFFLDFSLIHAILVVVDICALPHGSLFHLPAAIPLLF
jgi:hypothetical protein